MIRHRMWGTWGKGDIWGTRGTCNTWPLTLVTILAALAISTGCIHGPGAAGGSDLTLADYSDGTSRLVSALTRALQSRDRAKLEALCPASMTLSPATVESAHPFVSPAKLRVERYRSQPAGAAPLAGEAARALLLDRRERFAGIMRNEAHIQDIERRGDRCVLRVHTALAGVDATHARIQEESWWIWTLTRTADLEEGWTLTAAVEERRTLVMAPGPIFREVYPEEGDETKPWKPGTKRNPVPTSLAFPGEVDTGGVAVLEDCVDGGACILVAGGTGIAALTQGSPSEGGPFVDRAALLSLGEDRGEAKGILAGDFNNDGVPDLLITYQDAPCRLYQGRRYLEDVREGGDTTRVQHLGFEDVTQAAGLAGLKGSYRTAIGLDADLDGWLDIYVVQYGDAARCTQWTRERADHRRAAAYEHRLSDDGWRLPRLLDEPDDDARRRADDDGRADPRDRARSRPHRPRIR